MRTLLVTSAAEKVGLRSFIQTCIFNGLIFKINFDEILFIEGLKGYVIIQTNTQRIMTKTFFPHQ